MKGPGRRVLCAWCSVRVFTDGERMAGRFSVLTAFLHSGIPRELVIRLKYGGERHLAGVLARLALCGWQARPSSGDHIVPVPVSPARLRSRGFNQVSLLARELATLTGAEVTGLLSRHRGVSQVGSTAEERERNVRGTFSISHHRIPRGRVWLLDDVMTTGATMAEACRTLADAGIKQFHPAVVCFRKAGEKSIIHPKEVADEGVR